MPRKIIRKVQPRRVLPAMTIDDALDVILEAKRRMGGDRCLILSLTGSGIEDANVNAMVIQTDGKRGRIAEGDSGYIEVRCDHPSLPKA